MCVWPKDDKNGTYPLHLWAVTPHDSTPVFFRRIQNWGPFNLCATLDQGRKIFSTFTFSSVDTFPLSLVTDIL